MYARRDVQWSRWTKRGTAAATEGEESFMWKVEYERATLNKDMRVERAVRMFMFGESRVQWASVAPRSVACCAGH